MRIYQGYPTVWILLDPYRRAYEPQKSGYKISYRFLLQHMCCPMQG